MQAQARYLMKNADTCHWCNDRQRDVCQRGRCRAGTYLPLALSGRSVTPGENLSGQMTSLRWPRLNLKVSIFRWAVPVSLAANPHRAVLGLEPKPTAAPSARADTGEIITGPDCQAGRLDGSPAVPGEVLVDDS